jgi:hypothetical protein
MFEENKNIIDALKPEETTYLMEKYKNKIPVLCLPYDDKISPITKNKFMIKKTMKAYELIFILRNLIDTKHKYRESYFLFVNSPCDDGQTAEDGQTRSILLTGQHEFGEIYEKYKNKQNKYLIVYYNVENTFG